MTSVASFAWNRDPTPCLMARARARGLAMAAARKDEKEAVLPVEDLGRKRGTGLLNSLVFCCVM